MGDPHELAYRFTQQVAPSGRRNIYKFQIEITSRTNMSQDQINPQSQTQNPNQEELLVFESDGKKKMFYLLVHVVYDLANQPYEIDKKYLTDFRKGSWVFRPGEGIFYLEGVRWEEKGGVKRAYMKLSDLKLLMTPLPEPPKQKFPEPKLPEVLLLKQVIVDEDGGTKKVQVKYFIWDNGRLVEVPHEHVRKDKRTYVDLVKIPDGKIYEVPA